MARQRDSNEAVAAVITINYDTGEVMHTIFRESTGQPDPVKSCENFRASVEDDWPEHDHVVIGNKRAWEIRGNGRMKEWFGIDVATTP